MIRIGIVVLSWNEQKNIPRYLSSVLENLKNQRHSFHVDVLVFDNVSSLRFINHLSGWCKNNSSNHTTFSYMKHLFLSSGELDYEELLNSSCFVRLKE